MPRRDMSGNILRGGMFSDPQQAGNGHAIGYPAGTSVLTGWRVSGGGIDVLDYNGNASSRVVNLGSKTVISQEVDLVDGAVYELTFAVACASAGPSVKTGVVRLAGKTFPFTKANATTTAEIWQMYTFEVVGRGRTTLEIASTTPDNGNHGPFVGAVSLISKSAKAPPAPASASGRIVAVEGDMVAIDQNITVAGTHTVIRTKFFLQPKTQVASGWKPAAGSTVKIQFHVAPDNRRLIDVIGP